MDDGMRVPVPARTLVGVLDVMESGVEKARLTDAILATMDSAQRWVMEHWHAYVCEKCGHVMITDGRSLAERLAESRGDA